jgi:hypothetical protein
VGEAKAEIARSQELYRVAERADGSAVREDDAEPEPLEDESLVLGDGDVIAMAVKVKSVVVSCPFTVASCTLTCVLDQSADVDSLCFVFFCLSTHSPGATVAVAIIPCGPCCCK